MLMLYALSLTAILGSNMFMCIGNACMYNVMYDVLYAGLTALYRYWNPSRKDHFYTMNINEIGTAHRGQKGRHNYISEGIQCLIYTRQVKGSTPLYRYWKASVGDHFYTTNPNEIGTTTHGQKGRHGYVSEGITGYCFRSAVAGTVPLYRYYNGRIRDHFYTTNGGEIGTTTHGQTGRHQYTSEGVVCHVIPYYN